MAFVHVQGNAAGAAGPAASIGVTLGAAVGSGNLVVGWCSWGSATLTVLTSVTDDKGNTYTISAKQADAANTQSVGFFFLGNITNGPTVFTANFSPNQNFLQIGVDEYSGVLAAADPSDSHAISAAVQTGSVAADFLSSGNFTTAVNGDLIWGATVDTSTVALATGGTGYTRRTTNTSQCDSASEDKTQATAGSVAATFTAGAVGGRYMTYGAGFKPAAAAAQVPFEPWRQRGPILAQ